MLPYIVGKFAPNSSHLTRGLVKYVPGKGFFRAVSSQNGDKYVTCPPPPPPIVELVFVVVGADRINERGSVVVGILVKSRYSCMSPCHVRLFAEMRSN